MELPKDIKDKIEEYLEPIKNTQNYNGAYLDVYFGYSLRDEELERKEWAELAIKKQAIIEAKDTEIQSLKSRISDADFKLAQMEDYLHGEEGAKITRIRKILNPLTK